MYATADAIPFLCQATIPPFPRTPLTFRHFLGLIQKHTTPLRTQARLISRVPGTQTCYIDVSQITYHRPLADNYSRSQVKEREGTAPPCNNAIHAPWQGQLRPSRGQELRHRNCSRSRSTCLQTQKPDWTRGKQGDATDRYLVVQTHILKSGATYRRVLSGLPGLTVCVWLSARRANGSMGARL